MLTINSFLHAQSAEESAICASRLGITAQDLSRLGWAEPSLALHHTLLTAKSVNLPKPKAQSDSQVDHLLPEGHTDCLQGDSHQQSVDPGSGLRKESTADQLNAAMVYASSSGCNAAQAGDNPLLLPCIALAGKAQPGPTLQRTMQPQSTFTHHPPEKPTGLFSTPHETAKDLLQEPPSKVSKVLGDAPALSTAGPLLSKDAAEKPSTLCKCRDTPHKESISARLVKPAESMTKVQHCAIENQVARKRPAEPISTEWQCKKRGRQKRGHPTQQVLCPQIANTSLEDAAEGLPKRPPIELQAEGETASSLGIAHEAILAELLATIFMLINSNPGTKVLLMQNLRDRIQQCFPSKTGAEVHAMQNLEKQIRINGLGSQTGYLMSCTD